MSTLTDEQRKKIEENRLKALKRRSEASIENKAVCTWSGNAPNVMTPHYNQVVVPKRRATANSFTTFTRTIKYENHEVICNVRSPTSLLPKVSSVQHKYRNTEYTRGVCVLLTRKRFYIDMKSREEAINVFKTIPSREFDYETRKWSFNIEDHDAIISLLKPLHSKLLVEPLPEYVLKIFSEAKEEKRIKENDLSSLDPVLLNALLPFQIEGVNFGIQNEGRILLADEMGLGKTIQAIAIVDYFSGWPLLVVTPSSVRYAWKDAFHSWLPSMSNNKITVVNSGKTEIKKNKIILMSYDMLAKMRDSILKKKFKTVILDESHFIKSRTSARTKAALSVVKRAKYVLMLTGTPILSRPIELHTQISALRPHFFPNYHQYGLRYCNGRNPGRWCSYKGSSCMSELQLLLDETVMIRRSKSEVLKELPSKRRQVIVLDPSRVSTGSKVLKAMSRKMKEEELESKHKRGVLLKYFLETGAVKIRAVCEYIADLLETDRKFICFAHHQRVLDKICKTIERKKVDYIRIDGSVTSKQRKKFCDKFQLNDECKVAVLSITAANIGITLTAASLVVFAELFWNPGVLIQAEDRAHRIGQKNCVLVQYLLAKGTADDEIWPLVQRKLDVLNKAGLSEDTFKNTVTVNKEDLSRTDSDDFWCNLDEPLDINESDFLDDSLVIGEVDYFDDSVGVDETFCHDDSVDVDKTLCHDDSSDIYETDCSDYSFDETDCIDVSFDVNDIDYF